MHTTVTTLALRSLGLATLLAAPQLVSAQAPSLTPTPTPRLDQARAALLARVPALGLQKADAADPAVTSSYTDQHNGLTHVYLRQRVQGIEVLGAVADVHLNAAGQVAGLHSSFRPNAAATAARSAAASLTPEQALRTATSALGQPAPRSLRVSEPGEPAQGLVLEEGASGEKLPAKLMYLPMPNGDLRLVWNVVLPPTSEHWWQAQVDARSGELLGQYDLMVQERNTLSPLAATALTQLRLPAPAPAASPDEPVARPGGPETYNVYARPLESPSIGTRSLQAGPADPAASPYGWHDTNGAAGPEYTTTRGNNVYAYEDRNRRNQPGYSPQSPTLTFDYSINPAARPSANQDAAITNLFFWNNIVHDVTYQFGFNEASGNFQVNNYGKGGAGNDYVQAEAQDGSGLDNANFGTPADGLRPRMQMYTWRAQPSSVDVTAASGATSSLAAVTASFGGDLDATALRGKLVLALDTARAGTSLVCNEVRNAAEINGNIVLIDRGTCNFVNKVTKAQASGAIGVIVANNNGAAANMGVAVDDFPVSLTIPAVMVSQADGATLKALLAASNVTVGLKGAPDIDGDFDNGIIVHEYTHGISNRLTGGPANANCLPRNNGKKTNDPDYVTYETMGEGWSDFVALWLTMRSTDTETTPRPMGTYAASGRGIRPKPYSTDFSVNDATYDLIGKVPSPGENYAETHGVGYVWCAMLWDLNWALINKYGYNPDYKARTGGNNMCMQLVMDGMKLQPCSPGFVDGRNAILKADSINNNAANSALIWRVFARRGLGADAVQGTISTTDGKAGFSLPAGVLSTRNQLNEQLLEVYPNPAHGQLTIRTQVSSRTPVQVELVSLLGQTVRRQQVTAAQIQQAGVSLNTANLAGGVYVVRITTSEGTITKKVVVQP